MKLFLGETLNDSRRSIATLLLLIVCFTATGKFAGRVIEGRSAHQTPTPDEEMRFALLEGDVNDVVRAYERGACVNALGPNGETPLVLAARVNDVDSIDALIERGAAIDQMTCYGTPLSSAILCVHPKSAERLLKRGANPNHGDQPGRSPMWSAIYVGDDGNDVLDLLIEAGGNVNVRGEGGDTLLIRATRDQCQGLVRRLVRAGADLTARNDAGEAALDIAIAMNDSELIDTLQREMHAAR